MTDSIQIFVPLTLRKKNGRPKILPPARAHLENDVEQDSHILRAIGRAWSWRRRLEAGEFETAQDLAANLQMDRRSVSRQLRLAYLSPTILKRLIYMREAPALTLRDMMDITENSWAAQEKVVFPEGQRGNSRARGSGLRPPWHQGTPQNPEDKNPLRRCFHSSLNQGAEKQPAPCFRDKRRPETQF